MTAVVVAGVSARAMAESARRGGLDVIALDCFGDADTRAASRRWADIGGARPLQIDPDRFVAELVRAASEPDVRAWVPGPGFEAMPDALARGAEVLAMAGTAAGDVRRLRDARDFFASLDAAGIAHPAVRFDAGGGDATGWLVKDAGGRGGWHVRDASSLAGAPLARGCYLQREVAGVPMSATFLADGTTAHLLGINRQRVRRFGARRHVFLGVTGPVPLAGEAMHRMREALRHAVGTYRLKGLGSLDFMLDGEQVLVLEINPRPPASAALYERQASLMTAHLEACLDGRLPAAECATTGELVRGWQIVYALRPLALSAPASEYLARTGCHDRPLAGSRFAAGDPVCSLSAEGASADAVETRLTAAADELLTILETLA